jgi:hypothetical protein
MAGDDTPGDESNPPVLQGVYDSLREGAMPTTAARRLYGLLDSLVALQLEFASGTEADKELSTIGRAKILEVRTILDTAIYGVKRAIGDMERPRPTRTPGT